jgi:hypothetical protein
MGRIPATPNTTALIARSGGAQNSQIAVLFEVSFTRLQLTRADEVAQTADVFESARSLSSC